MKRLTILIGTLLVLGATTVLFGLRSTAPAAPRLIVAQTDQLLPSATKQDWVTYSDHLVLATMTGERRLAAGAEEQQAGEGFIPRVVTLRIDDLLWSRQGARPAPETVDLDLDGWRFKGETLTPVRMEGEPMLNAGGRYVLPLTYLEVTKTVSVPGWTALSADAILPCQNGVIGEGDVVAGRHADATGPDAAIRDTVWNQPLGSLIWALRSTAPDPAATMSLPPDERYQAVAAGSR